MRVEDEDSTEDRLPGGLVEEGEAGVSVRERINGRAPTL
jgi:hypothetical protein